MTTLFINPWFLAGLAGVAVPILIHILTRDRIRKVAFSTLRFFAQNARVTLQRKRWTELLVILLRVLVCALAALIFARPLLQGKQSERSYRQARVIVADVSASMTRAGGTAGLAAEIRKAADDLSSGSAVGLLTFDHAVREIAPLTDDRAATMAAKVVPGEGGTDLAPALRQANNALRLVDARRKDIVLISDLQRAGMQSYKGDWKLEPGVTLEPVVLSPASNVVDVGIADAQYPSRLVRDKQRRPITARVQNRGAKDLQDLTVLLRLDDRDVERQVVKVPAGGFTPVRFWHVFDRAGDNPGEIRVVCDDADPGDNRFYFNARVIPEIPVLLVGRAADAPDGTLFFLQKALNPGEGSPFAVKTVAASALRPADIAAASVLVFADVTVSDPALAAATRQLLNRGGGVLFLPGAAVTPDAFWAAWSAVAPCKLKRVISRLSPVGTAEGTLAKMDATHPVFEIFQQPHHGDFSAVRFARYWDVSESQASRVLARFDDGRPAILERLVGQGVCTLWLSPPDPAWNNLALRAIFLPLLHETVRQSAVRTEWPTVFAVGQVPGPPPGFAFTSEADRTASAPSALACGFHSMTNGEKKSLCYAVNRPFVEADGLRMKPEELKAAFEQPEGGGDAAGAATGSGRRGRELWWMLALAVAVLLPLELWVANRTARH